MFKEMIDTGTALKQANQINNINERVKYTANTGMVVINSANANVNGTGSITNVLTAGSNGCLIKQITIQALQNVTQGMVRIWVYNPYSLVYYLIDEVRIPGNDRNAKQSAFSVTYELDYDLNPALSLAASTQNAESFAIIAEGLDYSY